MERETAISIWKHLGPAMIDGSVHDLEEDFNEKGPITTALLEAMQTARDAEGFTLDIAQTNKTLARAVQEVLPSLDVSDFNSRLLRDYQERGMLMARFIDYARFALVLATEQFGCEDI